MAASFCKRSYMVSTFFCPASDDVSKHGGGFYVMLSGVVCIIKPFLGCKLDSNLPDVHALCVISSWAICRACAEVEQAHDCSRKQHPLPQEAALIHHCVVSVEAKRSDSGLFFTRPLCNHVVMVEMAEDSSTAPSPSKIAQ
jgi:hypothetical protein